MTRERILKTMLGAGGAREQVGLLPGVALAVGVMIAALPVSGALGGLVLRLQGLGPGGRGPISGVLVAVLLGVLIRNTVGVRALFAPGIRFGVTKVLRLGIICVGIKLSLFDVARLGFWGVPVVAAAVAAGLVFVTALNRALRLPERLGTLIAAGTGICGVTAIVSTAPAIDAEEREVTYAIANVTLFGLLGMFVYPYVVPYLLRSSEQVGLFLGTAIHDTSQVVGSALTYKEIHADDLAFRAATVTKLTRNLFLVAVVPVLSLYYARRRSQHDATERRGIQVRRLFPAFVAGFVGMALVRTLGDWIAGQGSGPLDPSGWRIWTERVGETWGAKYLLGTALSSVGLGTSFSVFRGIGLRPFAVGFAGALFVGLVGFLMAVLLGPFVDLEP